MRDKHGVYGRRQLLSLYSTALAPSDDVQSRLRSLEWQAAPTVTAAAGQVVNAGRSQRRVILTTTPTS